METFRIEAGSADGVQPSNIVGAIANEVGIESRYIGRIEIFENHSLVDLPLGMPKETFDVLKRAWVCSKQMRISRITEQGGSEKYKKMKPEPAPGGKLKAKMTRRQEARTAKKKSKRRKNQS